MYDRPKYTSSKHKEFRKGEILVELNAKYNDYFVSIRTANGVVKWVWPTEEQLSEFYGYYDKSYRAANKIFREMTLKKCLEILNNDQIGNLG